MIIDCPTCEAKVDATELAADESHDPDNEFDPDKHVWPCRVILLRCPRCRRFLLALQDDQSPGYGEEWGEPVRVWPASDAPEPPTVIPEPIRLSLIEAQRCLKARVYLASVVMSGRAIEGLCRHFDTENRCLGGAKELLEREITDRRLFQRSQELQRHRNIAAHASSERITKDDATDLFDFACAICNYVFVLTDKFQQLMSRKNKTETEL